MKQTTKSLVTMLALVVIAGAIGGVAYWAQKDEEQKSAAKEKSEKVFDFDKAKVTSLRLEKDQKLVAAAEKKDGHWQLVEPVKTEGDDVALNSLVDALATLKEKKDLSGEKDLKPFGLDKPRLKIDFDGNSLEVGADNPFDNTLYVRRAGDSIVRIVDGSQKASFDKSLFDLRDKRVAHLDDHAEVTRVEVSGVKKPYTLSKESGQWMASGAPADGNTVNGVINAVKNLRATAVNEGGAFTPKTTAKLTVAAGKDSYVRTVSIGQAGGKTLAKRDDAPTIYEVSDSVLKELDKEPFDLQDKSLVHVDREQVRKMVFESPAGKLAIARTKDGSDEKFEVVAPRNAPAKKWKASGALYSLTGLKAASFEAPKTAPKWEKTVTLLGDGDKALAKIQLGPELNGKRVVSVDGKLALVEKATLDDLPWKLEDAAELPAADGGVQASKP